VALEAASEGVRAGDQEHQLGRQVLPLVHVLRVRHRATSIGSRPPLMTNCMNLWTTSTDINSALTGREDDFDLSTNHSRVDVDRCRSIPSDIVRCLMHVSS